MVVYPKLLPPPPPPKPADEPAVFGTNDPAIVAALSAPSGQGDRVMDLEKVFAEIDGDPKLSEQQKLHRKARAAAAYRRLYNLPAPPRTLHHKNKTSVGGTLARSAARTLGSQIIRGLFRSFR